jgi:dipeptidyl aminopeptidase/acylaminoacyl peptidase
MRQGIVRRTALALLALAVSSFLGCGGTSQTLIYSLKDAYGNRIIWKQSREGDDKISLKLKGERPRWIPGTKTHFAYIERKPGSKSFKIWVADTDGKNAVPLSSKFEFGSEYSWSPDGKWLAVAMAVGNTLEIYKIKADGSQKVRLTNNQYTDTHPRWSPKGDKIAFVSNRQPESIYTINADGTGEKHLLSAAPSIEEAEQPAWSYDGKKIAFVGLKGDARNIWIAEVASGKVKQITKAQGPASVAHQLPLWEDHYVFYIAGNALESYDTDTGKTQLLKHFATITSFDPLTANVAQVFVVAQLGTSKSRHIYRVENHPTGTVKDLGPGSEPDVW